MKKIAEHTMSAPISGFLFHYKVTTHGRVRTEGTRLIETGRQQRGCLLPQAVKYTQVLLKIGQIIALTGSINKPLLLHLIGCLWYLYIYKAKCLPYYERSINYKLKQEMKQVCACCDMSHIEPQFKAILTACQANLCVCVCV